MKPKDRRMFELWSKTPEYRARIGEAKDIIRKYLKKPGQKYISYSGGKDSTVLMHMVLHEAPDTTIVHWDYGFNEYGGMPKNLQTEVIEIAKTCGAENIEIYYSESGNIEKDFLQKVVPMLIKEKKYRIAFIGLRAEEGCRRKSRTREGSEVSVCGAENVYPISRLTYKDIWAYLITNNVPYLSYYDRMSEIMEIKDIRFGVIFNPDDRFVSEYKDKYILWKENNSHMFGGEKNR
jgi:3'-phosphoadenosine 5'-phosphosulfate sulfotransferase (PAPS reductase)/FAD synthetase